MASDKKAYRIKIVKNGPYLVTGNVPLSEKIIVSRGKCMEYKNGRTFPVNEEYSLCRCGKSRNSPFCDGAHERFSFIGTETASKEKYEDRAELIEGPSLDLLDDNRCAYARFCHRENGTAWELAQKSDDEENRNELIQAAIECPSGRLVAKDKTGKIIEPEYEPSIEILQDPEEKSSGGIFVKGNIPIESSDGEMYEVRNRVVLCRCGKSRNKPFCDATHIPARFSDGSRMNIP